MDLKKRLSLASLELTVRETAQELGDHCDTVDVWDASGRLLFGRVVDVAENGLYIDLLCAGRRRELIPFGRIFHRPFGVGHDLDEDLSCTMEVLLRPQPQSPWTWVSGELAMHSPTRLMNGLSATPLRLLNAEGVAAGPLLVVPSNRIRYPPVDLDVAHWNSILAGASGPPRKAALRGYYGEDYKRALVRRGDYAAGRVQLPAPCAALPEPVQRCVREAWRGRCRSMAVLRCGMAFERRPGFVFVRRLEDTEAGWFFVERTDPNWVDWPHWTGFKENAARLQLALPRMLRMLDLSVDAFGDDVLRLSAPILSAVFAHLDTIQQTRVRPVCALWDGVLQSGVLANTLVIGPNSYASADYVLMATIRHCLRTTTRNLILRGGDLYTVYKLAAIAAHFPRIRVPVVHLVRMEWQLSVDACPHNDQLYNSYPNWVADLADALRRLPGAEVVILHCRVRLLNVDPHRTVKDLPNRDTVVYIMDIPVHIPVARLQPTSADLAGSVWALIAEGVEWRVTGEDERRAAEWVAWIKANRAQLQLTKHSPRYWEGTMVKILCQTLCALQAVGLGAGPPGLGGCQCADAIFRLAPPLSQLSPLALGCVVQCAEEWELRCEGRLWYGKTDERAGLRALLETRAWRP